jgi:hypothetical protein
MTLHAVLACENLAKAWLITELTMRDICLDPVDPCKVNMCTMKTLQQLHPTDISIYTEIYK